ncbi:MAG TPA: autotransporter-associated beta strand repeat-containing protein [Candidatus Acidoferrum sp.]|nr:autotransporter-associated beta strand repeat-containing protein [Candidatus Acidoferrum sp.]
MNTSLTTRYASILLTFCLLLALPARQASAAVLWWDNNTTSTPGSGTWDTTTKNWATSSVLTTATVVWATADAAVFVAGGTSPGAITITVTSAVNFAGMFANGVGGSSCSPTFSGTGSLNLGAGLQGFYISPSQTITVNVPITGTGGVEQQGSGVLSLYGNNTYTGGTEITGGQTLNYNNNNSFGTGTIIIGGNSGGLASTASTALTIANNFSFPTAGWNLNLAGGVPVGGLPGTTFTGNFPLPAGTTMLYTGGAGQLIEIAGPISGAGATLIISDPGTMWLAGVNTYTGNTSITNTLGSPNPALKIIGSGCLGGGNYAGTITNAGSFTYASSAAQTLSGVILGAGTVTNSGPGTLTLSGVNTYNGATVVTGGEIVGVTGGSCASSAVTANSTGVLGVSVTDPTKQWTCPSATFSSGTPGLDFNFGIVTPSTSLAPLNVTGAAAFTVTPTVTVEGSGLVAGGGPYPLMTWGSTSGTPPASVNMGPHASGTLSVVGNTLYLTVSANTEPLTWNVSGTGAWDINTSQNWVDNTATAAFYLQPSAPGDAVVFADTYITASPTVTLNTTVSPASVLANNSTYNYTISGSGGVAGSAALTKQGSASLTLLNANTYSGGTTISAGTLQLGDGATGNGSVAGNITDNANLTFANFNPQTFGGVISGSGALTAAGPAKLILTGLSSLTGLATINSGVTLQLGDGVGNNGSLAGNISNSGSLVVSNFNPQTYSGAISGTGTLTLGGPGTLTLSGANTYSGGTTINAGTLSVNTIADSGTSALGYGTALNLNGGTLSYSGAAAATTTRAVTLSGTASVIDLPGGSLEFNSQVKSGTFTKTSSGTLTLSGSTDNSSLGVTVNAGKVVLNKASSSTVHGVGVATTVNSGGTLQLSGSGGYEIFSGVTVTVASGGVLDANGQSDSFTKLNLAGTGISSGGALINSSASTTSTLTLSSGLVLTANSSVGGSGSITVNSVISGGFALTYVGTGTLTLTNVNTYTGATTNSSSSGTLTIASGGKLNSGSYSGLIANSGTFNFNSPVSQTLSGIISGSGPINVTGGAGCILTLSGANTFTGLLTINNDSQVNINALSGLGTAPASTTANALTLNFGFLRVQNASVSLSSKYGITLGTGQSFGGISLGGSIQVASGLTMTIPGVITGPSAFMVGGGTAAAGYGTNLLSGANTYLGGTAISTGWLRLGANGSLPYGTTTVIAADNNGGAGLDLGGFSQTIGPLASTNAFSGTAGSGTPTIVLSGALTVLETNVNTTFGGKIVGAGGSLTINGDSTLTLTNVNSYTGNTTISAGGLTIGGAGSLGSGSYAGAIANSGTFTYNSSAAQTLSGVVSGTGALNQTGSGTLTLTGTDTYTGATTVSAGKLLVNGSLAAGSAVTVSGGTLGGNGTIGGLVTVNAAGTLAPGASIGTLTLAVAPVLGGTTAMEINKAAGPVLTSDKLVVSPGGGTLVYGGTLAITASGLPLASGDTFTLFAADSFSGSFSSIAPATPGPGLLWDTSRLAVDGTIKVLCDGTLAASAGPNQNICSGSGTTIGGSPTATGGTGSYTYSWSPTAGLSSATVANPNASPTSTTLYTVTVTDSGGCTAMSSVTVALNTPPTISTQPASQAACAGSTATFSVTATGSGLSYSWAQHNNTGWGSPWQVTGGGSSFLASSTDNDFGDPACFTFSTQGDINSPSMGHALGLWGGFTGDEQVTRTFALLAAGQVVSIDFDNGNVDTGSKVGFSLEDNTGTDLLQFYFLGGAANYKYWDTSAGEQDSGIPFERTGLRVQFVLTAANTYSLIVTPCGGTATTFSGAFSGTIAQVKLFNGNTTGGDDKNAYFNNFLVGGYADNADNYGSAPDFAGKDLGDQPIVAGNGSSTYTTPPLTTADNGSVYEVTVSGCGGAVLSSPATLTVNPQPTVSVNSATICAGGSANLVATTSASTPSYLWSPGGATTAGITVSPSSTTTYTVTVTDGTTGCTNTASGTVTVNPLPTVSVNSQTICAGGSAILTATTSASNPSYLWNDPDASTTPSITVSPATTTTYTVTVTDGVTGCVNTGSGTVTVNPLPTVAVNSQTICAGASATLTATTSAGSPSFLWSPGGATTPSITVSPASTTTYTVTVTDGTTGCANSGSGTVTVNPLPTVTVNSQAICAGSSATLTANTSAGSPSFLWSPGGATTPSITVSPASTTTYTVTVTDEVTGCVNMGNGTVTVNPQPTLTLDSTNQTVCAGMEVTWSVAASGDGATYQWQRNGTNLLEGVDNFTGTTHATLTNSAVSALDAADTTNGYDCVISIGSCSVTSSVVSLTVLVAPTVSVNSQTICAGGSAMLTATSDATNPAYLWSPGGATTASITVSPAVTTTYTVTVTDGTNVCPGTGSGTVTVNPLPDVSVNSETICAGGSAMLTATTGASSPSYLWNDPNASTTPSITVSPAATTTYTVTVTDGVTGCANTGSGTVTVNPLPTVAVNSQTICAGGSATLTASTSADSPSYLWSPGGATTPSITVSPASTTTYTVTVTDGTTGCANSANGTVTVNPLPTVSVNSAGICTGGSTTLTATTSAGSPSFLWSPGGATTPSITVSPASTTTYTVTVTDGVTGCANSGSGTVTVNTAPTADAGSDQTVCAGTRGGTALGGDPTASGGTPPYTYSWSPTTGLSDPTAANPTAEIGSTTTYTVTVTDQNGCTATASVVLTIPPLPNIESITMSGTDVTLVWDSLSGQAYRVQYTSDLTPPATWTDLTPDVTAAGATATYTDHAGGATPRFYRIMIVCPSGIVFD